MDFDRDLSGREHQRHTAARNLWITSASPQAAALCNAVCPPAPFVSTTAPPSSSSWTTEAECFFAAARTSGEVRSLIIAAPGSPSEGATSDAPFKSSCWICRFE
eukprot:2679110-Rhodomonas_salina.1